LQCPDKQLPGMPLWYKDAETLQQLTKTKIMSLQFIQPWEDPTGNDRLEIVFQHRFKNYGAYAIRRQYHRNKLIAMFVSAFAVALMFSAFKIHREDSPFHFKNSGPVIPIDTLGVTPDNKGEEDRTPNNRDQEKGGEADLIPLIDLHAPEILKFVRNANGNSNGIGNSTGDFSGIGNDGLPKDDGNGFPGSGGGNSNTGRLMSRSCSYPGGEDAFIRYIQDNFIPPVSCLESNLSAWVKVQFSINTDGSLTEVRILESSLSCPEFLEETQKVLLGCPKWIAALDKGLPVKCKKSNYIKLVY